jgi:hypothetical protein
MAWKRITLRLRAALSDQYVLTHFLDWLLERAERAERKS